jgi:hypothetical protein
MIPETAAVEPPRWSGDPARAGGDQVAPVVRAEDDAAIAIGIRTDPGETPEIAETFHGRPLVVPQHGGVWTFRVGVVGRGCLHAVHSFV